MRACAPCRRSCAARRSVRPRRRLRRSIGQLRGGAHSARRGRRRLLAAVRDARAGADRKARKSRGPHGAHGSLDRARRAAVMNDALLSGSVDFIAAGPPAFITLWDRTRGSADVRGVAAMSSLPMYLNTTNPALTSIDDLTADGQDRRHGRQGVDPVDQHADVRGRTLRRGRSLPLRSLHGDHDACRRVDRAALRLPIRSTRTSLRRRSISAKSRIRACAPCSTPTTSWAARRRSRCCRPRRGYREANPAAYAAVLAALEEAERADPQRPASGRARSCSRRNRPRGFRSRSSSRCCATRHSLHDDAREHRKIRRVHARDRLDRESAGLVARSVLPRNSRSGRLLIRDRTSSETHDRA